MIIRTWRVIFRYDESVKKTHAHETNISIELGRQLDGYQREE